jgi:hypothetical protein
MPLIWYNTHRFELSWASHLLVFDLILDHFSHLPSLCYIENSKPRHVRACSICHLVPQLHLQMLISVNQGSYTLLSLVVKKSVYLPVQVRSKDETRAYAFAVKFIPLRSTTRAAILNEYQEGHLVPQQHGPRTICGGCAVDGHG